MHRLITRAVVAALVALGFQLVPGSAAFAESYSFNCHLQSPPLDFDLAVDVTGDAPPSVPQGQQFQLTNVVVTISSPIFVGNAPVRNLSIPLTPNGTISLPQEIAVTGSFTYPPTTVTATANGTVGSTLGLAPSGNASFQVQVLLIWQNVTCTGGAGDPFASTTIGPPPPPGAGAQPPAGVTVSPAQVVRPQPAQAVRTQPRLTG